MNERVRVRFAPAPTGYLHVGGARTALYDWLFARHHGGVFILRVEDTDQSRSTDESVTGLQDSLRWLGIDWEEGPEVGGPLGPYRQTERIPAYAHLPLIVGPDRQPLSKRHGSVAVEWFREEGYLPEALVNYLALLGWSYDDHTELFGRDDLVAHFDLKRVSRNPAMFDQEKLDWMNGHYIREAEPDRLAGLLGERLTSLGVDADPAVVREGTTLVQERSRTINEAADMLRFLFEDVEPNEKARKLVTGQGEYLSAVADRLEALEDWSVEAIRAALEALA